MKSGCLTISHNFMLTLTKNQVWEDLEREYARTVDGLGKRIDKGIMDTVIALNANDIHTTASCEGHLDWGCPYPWVDIGSGDPKLDEIEQQIAELLYEGKRDEVGRLYLEVKHFHYQEELKLIPILESFYQHYPLHYDRHLIFIHDIRGGCRIQSQGADTQEMRSQPERAQKLKEYQSEMQAFTDFLRRQFFGDKTEYTTAEAANVLGVEQQTIKRNILRGNLVARKMGRDYIINASEFERFKTTPRRSGRPKGASDAN